nr:hypothetical protein [uncultured Paracoccus sp.]
MLKQRPLSTAIAVEMCRMIKGVKLDIRNTPGTALMNDATGAVIQDVLTKGIGFLRHHMISPRGRAMQCAPE